MELEEEIKKLMEHIAEMEEKFGLFIEIGFFEDYRSENSGGR